MWPSTQLWKSIKNCQHTLDYIVCIATCCLPRHKSLVVFLRSETNYMPVSTRLRYGCRTPLPASAPQHKHTKYTDMFAGPPLFGHFIHWLFVMRWKIPTCIPQGWVIHIPTLPNTSRTFMRVSSKSWAIILAGTLVLCFPHKSCQSLDSKLLLNRVLCNWQVGALSGLCPGVCPAMRNCFNQIRVDQATSG